jgi:hypothetical protein
MQMRQALQKPLALQKLSLLLSHLRLLMELLLR